MSQAAVSAFYEGVGESSRIKFVEHVLPDLKANDLMIKVKATSLNRADLLQRQGLYSPPSGETKVPGVEVAGEVVELGSANSKFHIGDRVCGVVGGGAYSNYCILDSGMAITIPDAWDYTMGAAFSEAALTANEALVELGGIGKGSVCVLHAGASGMTTMMIKMAKKLGARVITTTTSDHKVDALRALGADLILCKEDTDYFHSVQKYTKESGADAVIDFLGGRYFNSNVAALRPGGVIVSAGILDGAESRVNLVPLINKRIRVLPLSLRMKPIAEKRQVTARFIERWWDGVEFMGLTPTIDRVYSFDQIDEAQQRMALGLNIGKIVVENLQT